MLVSIQILPQEVADADPVGKGRKEPNCSPFLPKPTGRVNLSFRTPLSSCFQLPGNSCCDVLQRIQQDMTALFAAPPQARASY